MYPIWPAVANGRGCADRTGPTSRPIASRPASSWAECCCSTLLAAYIVNEQQSLSVLHAHGSSCCLPDDASTAERTLRDYDGVKKNAPLNCGRRPQRTASCRTSGSRNSRVIARMMHVTHQLRHVAPDVFLRVAGMLVTTRESRTRRGTSMGDRHPPCGQCCWRIDGECTSHTMPCCNGEGSRTTMLDGSDPNFPRR